MQSKYKEIVIESDNPRNHHQEPWNDGSWSTLDYMQIRASENSPHQCPTHHHHRMPVPPAEMTLLLFPYHLTNHCHHHHHPRPVISCHKVGANQTEAKSARDGASETSEESESTVGKDDSGVERVARVAVEDTDVKKHKCLVIRRQIVSSKGIPLIPLLFLLLLVTTSALPPVIRIGKWRRLIPACICADALNEERLGGSVLLPSDAITGVYLSNNRHCVSSAIDGKVVRRENALAIEFLVWTVFYGTAE